MREIPYGVVQSRARQKLARALRRNGPLRARELMEDTGLSIACSRYHLRALATVGAVMPYLDGLAGGDEVAWVMRPEKLPERAREALLGEVSMRPVSGRKVGRAGLGPSLWRTADTIPPPAGNPQPE